MKGQVKKKSHKKAVIICNGKVLTRASIAPLLRDKPLIVCADGGANKARRLGITPDIIIGDLDSITSSTKKYFSRVPSIQLGSQNSTDLEKALDYLLKLGIQHADVLGATGGRPDHMLSNFSILKKYRKRISLRFIDPYGTLQIIEGTSKLDLAIGSLISLIPLGRCDGITTTGLKYPLSNETLELGVREGTSNEVIAPPVSIKVKKGCLLIFIAANPTNPFIKY